jgi:hypothetical protein
MDGWSGNISPSHSITGVCDTMAEDGETRTAAVSISEKLMSTVKKSSIDGN